MGESETAFGASWAGGPAGCVAVLRAQASRVVDLEPVSVVDAAAAVVAGHAWCLVAGETSLSSAHRHARAMQTVAARVLARAAGRRRSVEEPGVLCPRGPVPVSARLEEPLAVAVAWVEAHVPDAERGRVFAAAATDLLSVPPGPLSGPGWVFALHATD